MMTSSPAISVVIPLYNKRAYILRAVRSVLAQKPAPLEILVIDDGSTDDGPDLLERCAECSDVRLIRQKNSGEGAARNRGLAEMRGNLAAFLDADDEWQPGHLRNILELAHRYPDAGVFATGYRSVYRPGVVVETAIAGGSPVLLEDYFEAARGEFCLHISSCAVWKAAATGAGGFAEGEPLGADLEFFARLALQYRVALHPAVSGIYHAGLSGSAIHTQTWANRMPPVVRLLREAPARSARDYADWILLEHALTGFYAGATNAAAALLPPTLLRSSWLAQFGAWKLPLPVLRPMIRWRRSRWSVGRRSASRTIASRMV